MRKEVAKHLERGKIDVSFHLEDTGTTKSVSINKALAAEFYKDLKEVNESIGEQSEDYLAMIMRLPEVLTTEKDELGKEERTWVFGLLDEAIEKLSDFRSHEGQELVQDFTGNIEGIRTLLNQIHEFEDERVEGIQK